MTSKTTTKPRLFNIPGYDGLYRVSDSGEVFSYTSKRKGQALRRRFFDGTQQPAVQLSRGGEVQGIAIPILMLRAILKVPVPARTRVRFVDGDPSNCRLENLVVLNQPEVANALTNYLARQKVRQKPAARAPIQPGRDDRLLSVIRSVQALETELLALAAERGVQVVRAGA